MSEHKNLASALLAFKAKCPQLPKDKVNPHFKSKYTSLDAIAELIDPLLTQFGLVWTVMPHHVDGRPVLNYQLIHAQSGESLSGQMPLLLDRENSQGLGSALTYSRRYAKVAVLDLVTDEDDDGHAASHPRKAQPPVRMATPKDIETLKGAAAGLKAEQIKRAFQKAGVPVPDPFLAQTVFARVPQAKAADLFVALGQEKAA